MNRVLPPLLALFVLLCVSLQAFSQVKLTDIVASKVYENNTRITYFDMADFPNTADIREYVEKQVVEDPDIIRLFIYNDGTHAMYEAMQKIEPEMIVDAINDAVEYYFLHADQIEAEKKALEEKNKYKFDPFRQIEKDEPLPPATVVTVEPVEKQTAQPDDKQMDESKTVKMSPNLTRKQNVKKSDIPINNILPVEKSVVKTNK